MHHRFGIKALLGASIALALSFSANAGNTPPTTTRYNISSLKDGGHYDRFIVTYRDGTTQRSDHAAAAQNVQAAISRAGLAQAAAGRAMPRAVYQRKLAIGSDLVRTSRKLDKAEATALIKQIASDPAVLSVAPDVLRHPVRDFSAPKALQPATFTPSDTYYGNYQWDLKPADGSVTAFGHTNNGGSNVNNAWDVADGTGITIAVLDTGITSHVDVDTSLADAGYDFTSDSLVSGRATDGRAPGGWDLGDWTTTEPYLSACTNSSNPPEDSSWHGTHVASTAGGELTNNSQGMAGIAYKAKILPVRVLGHCGGYDSDISDAIVWAAGGHVDGVPDNTHPAQVINMSLGGSGTCSATDPEGLAVAKANSLGAVVVVAAGNSNADASRFSPASCPGVITVAATGITSRRAFYSNYGSTVDLAAPGGGIYENDGSSGTQSNDGFIWQALNSGTTTPVPNDSTYGGYAGTSQATPHVAGAVALMQSARLASGQALLSPSAVLGILQSTAYAPSIKPSRRTSIGAGILDANAAVRAAVSSTGSSDGGNTGSGTGHGHK